MAASPSSISIFVEPPSDDLCGPLDFGDGSMVVDPPFDTTGFSQYLSGPFDSQRDVLNRSQKYAEGIDTLSVPHDRLDLGDYYPDSRPYPFGSLSYNVPRSPTEDYSPYSSTLGDDFSPSTTPSVHGGTLSPSTPSFGELPQSALSPTFLGDLSLPFTELNINYSQSPSAFRIRSHSVTERTVAPSDTWCDPAARPGVRSAPPTTSPLPEDTTVDHIASSDVSECDPIHPSGGIVSPANEGDLYPSADGLYPGVSVTTGLELAEHRPDARSGLLFGPHNLRSEFDPTTSSTHRRGHSDSSGFLSPTSPVDRRGIRAQHRKASSASGSVRHTPYPVSAPATPEASFGLPELGGRFSVQRRHSGPSSSRPKLSIDVPHPLVCNKVPASSQPVYFMPSGSDEDVLLHVPSMSVKSEWNQSPHFNQPSPSVQLAHGMMDHSSTCMADQPDSNSAASNGSSSGWKDRVGSRKIVDASNARRKRESKFTCSVPGCRQTFTAKHNWKYHKLSHSGERPFPCGKCMDCFTTPGVANRHRTKCPGLGGTAKRRRTAASTASPLKLAVE